jgi:hypothetical protein
MKVAMDLEGAQVWSSSNKYWVELKRDVKLTLGMRPGPCGAFVGGNPVTVRHPVKLG